MAGAGLLSDHFQAADAKACQEQNSKDLDHVISF